MLYSVPIRGARTMKTWKILRKEKPSVPGLLPEPCRSRAWAGPGITRCTKRLCLWTRMLCFVWTLCGATRLLHHVG